MGRVIHYHPQFFHMTMPPKSLMRKGSHGVRQPVNKFRRQRLSDFRSGIHQIIDKFF
jgi:hypothetical protein